MQEKIQLQLSTGQAEAMQAALDFYSRVCSGQIEELGYLIRTGQVPAVVENSQVPAGVRASVIDHYIDRIKSELGLFPNEQYGILHNQVPANAKRCYEIYKEVAKVLASYKNPEPTFKGVDYDGCIVRATNDELPDVGVVLV